MKQRVTINQDLAHLPNLELVSQDWLEAEEVDRQDCLASFEQLAMACQETWD